MTQTAINTEDRAAHQRLGLLYEYLNNFEASAKHLRIGVRELPPHIVGLRLNLARVLNELSHYGEAVLLLESRAPLASDLIEAHLVLGTAYLKTDRAADALSRFERASALQPELPEAYVGQVIALRKLGEPQQALALLQAHADSYPNKMLWQLEAGETYLHLNDLAHAQQHFAFAKSAGAPEAPILRRLAQYHTEQGELDSAEALYQQLLKQDLATADTYVKLAELNQTQLDHDEALDWLSKGVTAYPDSAYLLFRLGSYYAALGQYSQAVEPMQNALQLAPQDPIILKSLSLVYAKQGDTKQSAAVAKTLSEVTGGRINELLFYATRLEADSQQQAAISSYREVLTTDADNIIALNNLAVLLTKTGKADEAEGHIAKATQLVSDNGQLLDTLGWTYYHQGRYQEAAQVFEKALVLAPDSASLHYHAGKAFLALGQQQQAEQMLRKAIEMNKDASWYQDAVASIAGDGKAH